MSKECTKCGETKALSEFSKDKYRKDGLVSQCKECKRLYMRKRKRELQDIGHITPDEKECTKCHEVKKSSEFSKFCHSRDGLNTICKQCHQERAYTRDGRIGRLVDGARNSTINRNKKGRGHSLNTIETEYLIKLLDDKDNCCDLSDQPLTSTPGPFQMSLDRIKDSKGYVEGNVRVVGLVFNTAKKWTEKKFAQVFKNDPMTYMVVDASFEKEKRQTQTQTQAPRYIHCWREGYFRCLICDTEKPITEVYANKSQVCKPCYSRRMKEYHNTPIGRLHQLTNRAKTSHNLRCNTSTFKRRKHRKDAILITYDDLVEIWIRQGGRCFYSDMPMQFDGRKDWLVSLERKKPLKTYTKNNVVLVCAEFNATDHAVQTGVSTGWTRELVQKIRAKHYIVDDKTSTQTPEASGSLSPSDLVSTKHSDSFHGVSATVSHTDSQS